MKTRFVGISVLVAMSVALMVPTQAQAATVPDTPPASKIPSSFISAEQASAWSDAMWTKQLDDLRSAGVTEIVLNAAVKQTAAGLRAYYPSGIPGVQAVVSSPGVVSVVDELLEGARARGMQVWLGTYLPDQSWFRPNQTTVAQMVEANASTTIRVLTELDAKYLAYADVIAGWYFSSEVNAAWGWSGSTAAALISYFARITAVASTAVTGSLSMTSPYYDPRALPDSTVWTKMWTRILQAAPISVFALQDGTGDCADGVCGPWRSPTEEAQALRIKFSSSSAAIAATGNRTQLWANVNFYDEFGFSNPIGDLAAAYDLVDPYAVKFTSWSFSGKYAPWSIGTNVYALPFRAWNSGKALSTEPPSNVEITAVVRTPGGIQVTWKAARPAAGNNIAFYRVLTPQGTRLAQRTDLTWFGSAPCVLIQAVDTAGNVSIPTKTC